MVCPHCQTHNPAEAKFCMDCGKSFSVECPQCGKHNLPRAKFCINCGHKLSEHVKEPTDSVQRFIPKEFAEKLEAAREHQAMEGERRIATILFCDIKGSTAMAEHLDPEEWAEIMNEAFEFLISPIYKYEGTLARLMGDSILAFFGAPIAHEDDAQRAILAGLDIISGIQPFRKRIENLYNLDFDVRVGINTGLVVVGGVGSDLFMEYTALGDAINIASRMEQTAQPGTIQIAEDTYKRVRPFFEFEEIKGIEIKGKSLPLEVYRVIRKKEKPGQRRGIQGSAAPLIGRSGESGKLEGILGEVIKGRGQILSLIGEAGLGKTRLLKEAEDYWAANVVGMPSLGSIPSRWNQVLGISYETSQPYRLIQRLIRNFIGVTASDLPEQVRKALIETFTSSGMKYTAETRSLFETILGVKEQTNGSQLEGEGLKRAIYQELVGILDQLVQQGPTVIAIDDLHWSDQASADFIIHLLQLADRLPILFLCSFRPDTTSPAWTVKQAAETQFAHRYSEIILSPLSVKDSNEFVDRLFPAHLPVEVRKLILGKTDGNPFFMEEVIRTLYENEFVIQDPSSGDWSVEKEINSITIPDNLQALLSARIDRLEDTAKHVLQMASVIGRSFYHQVLEVISDVTFELDHELNNLQRLGLILESSREPYLEYVFRQALTQETAYNTILLKTRREFHKRVGEALLHLFIDRTDEFAAILGHHFYQAQDDRALQFFKLEGDSAFRLYANQEAVSFYSQAIEVAMWAEQPDLDQLTDLYACRGRAFELISQFAEALENYREMQEIGKKFNSDSIELQALIARAQMHSIPSDQFDISKGINLLETAQQMAELHNDQVSLAKIYWIMTNLHRFHSSLNKAQQVGEKAIAIARDLDLEEQLAYSLTDTSHTYNMDGKVDRAIEVSLEAVELWKKLGNLPMLADCLGGLAAISTFAGNFDDAYRYSDEAFEISLKIENIWGQSYSRYAIGLVDFERGDVDLAISHFEGALRDAVTSKFLAGLILTKSFLSVAYSDLGLHELALDTIEGVFDDQPERTHLSKSFFLGALLLSYIRAGNIAEAEQIMADEKETIDKMIFFARQHFMLAICYLAFEKDDYKSAIKEARSALKIFRGTGVKLPNSELLLIIGKSHIAMEAYDEAVEVLKDARKEAVAIGSRRNLWQIDYQLGFCSLLRGDKAEAEDFFTQARESLLHIIEHISNDEIKGKFMNRTDVIRLLETQEIVK